MQNLDKALRRQLDRNKSKNVLYSRLDEIIEIDPEFLAALEELLGEEALDEPALRDAISSASKMVLERVYSVNQFLQIDERMTQQLERIYRRTWQRIVQTKNIQGTLKDYHYPQLTKWIASSYPRSFRQWLKSLPAIGHVVCEEYSPQLQIDLLRLELPQLKKPVLDIGCGRTAGLVRHLRGLGIEAFGIDRQTGEQGDYIEETNWFDYEFEPDAWGIIVSNMAFTNHVLHAYHHDNALLEHYLAKFKQILESLTVAGSFYYAPSIPFVEQRLDTYTYRVQGAIVVKEISMTRITRIAK